jgi:hypothetical protein
MYGAYITTYLNKDLLSRIINENTTCVNLFVDVRSVAPAFFKEQQLKLVINDETNIDLYVRKTLLNFLKFVDFHIQLIAFELQRTPRIFFFSDIGQSEYHKQIDKSYKENRGSPIILTEEEYIRSKQLVNGLLEAFGNLISFIPGIFYLHLHYMESDFLPYYILKNFSFSKNEVFIIVSRDKDLAQCLALYPETSYQFFLDHKGQKTLLDAKSVVSYHFKVNTDKMYPPQLIALGLAIAGDNADNIIGIKQIGYKRFLSIIDHIESQNNIQWSLDNMQNLEYLLSSDVKKPTIKNLIEKIRQNRDLIEKNLKLVDFNIISSNLASSVVHQIHQSLKYNKILNENLIKQYVKQIKEVTDQSVYPYFIVQYLKFLAEKFKKGGSIEE